jgi:hypothetical protein
MKGVFHQFEVRYTGMLNFSNIGKNIVGPYVQLANRISIENEGRINERLRLHFDSDSYHIDVHWDRLVLRYEGDLGVLIERNSIIEEPYFSILGKLQEQDTFGHLTDHLAYTIFVKVINKSREEIFERFNSKMITQYASELVEGFTDTAVTIERISDELEENITYGPYLGISDILRRVSDFSHKSLPFEADARGVICEVKMLKRDSNIDFKIYKSLVTKILGLNKGEWE